MDYSPPGSSVRGKNTGKSPGKNNEAGCHVFLQGIFPTQESNMGLLHCRQILYWLSHQRSPNGRRLCPFPSKFPSHCPEWATVKFSECSSLLSIVYADTLHAILQKDFSAFLWDTKWSHTHKVLRIMPSTSYFFGHAFRSCRISVLRSGIEPETRQWKPRILTTRPPGNSRKFLLVHL